MDEFVFINYLKRARFFFVAVLGEIIINKKSLR